MEPGFWHERWRTNQIPFHQAAVNRALVEYWPRLGARPGEPVLVPLCGKSLDMRWLAAQGHPVLGIELDPIAVAAFFSEQGAVPRMAPAGACRAYADGPYRLLQGDFFAVRPADVGPVRLVYDRAALIALPPVLRPRYCRHLASLLAADAALLLLTFEYDQSRMNGPPFSVPQAEVHERFAAGFEVDCLERRSVLDQEPRFRERGLEALDEVVWRLRRRPA